MRATSSTTAWTWSGVIVGMLPTSSPVAGLKDCRVDRAAGFCSVVAIRRLYGGGGCRERARQSLSTAQGRSICVSPAGQESLAGAQQLEALTSPLPAPSYSAAMGDQLFDTGESGISGPQGPGVGAPVAVRMRPRNLDELVGQEHILGEGSALRSAIESGHPHSAILYGPPGAGKTTLARIAAAGAEGAVEEEAAVTAGKAETREVIERARERRKGSGRPTILFLDEIHRFNKAQQDALLPAAEEGLLTVFGATSEKH